MLVIGAEKDFLLKSLKECMAKVFGSFLENVLKDAVIVAESNILKSMLFREHLYLQQYYLIPYIVISLLK